MYSTYDKDASIAVLALDAQKAFDRLEWSQILTVMKELSVSKNFISWVEMLYSSPKA